MDLALDELKTNDAEIVTDNISIIYNPKEKLYYHRCVIDCPDDQLVVVPWFSGFH